MSFAPLLNAGPVIAAHAFAAMLAFVLGGAQLILEQRGLRHRLVGYIWVSLMALVSISSFWIHDLRVIGPFSPIHLLSIVTLASLVIAIRAIRRGDIPTHRATMRWLFFAALVGAGAFTFLPGRVMYAVVTTQ